MTKSDLTICIPTYNAERTIGATLESVCPLGFPIVVLDNASTDSTFEIVQKLQVESWSNIRLERNASNIGYAANVNAAVEIATTEYVAILHSDDLYTAAMFDRMTEVLASEGADLVSCRYSEFWTTPSEAKRPKVYVELDRVCNNDVIVGGKETFFPLFMRVGNFLAAPSWIVKRSRFLALSGVESLYPSNEDYHHYLKLLEAGGKIAFVNTPLFYYRRSQSQGSSHFNARVSMPEFYLLTDKHVAPSFEPGSLESSSYGQSKAGAYILLFKNARRAKIRGASRYLKESRSCHRFPLFSKKGLLQVLGGWFIWS